MTWEPMDHAPLDGTLIDLNFNGIRYTDCHFNEAHNCWAKQHGYPAMERVFFAKPTGWQYRPDDLVDPYETTEDGVKYVP
ncbi:MAG TPA: hypothetical protein VF638_14395 [Sphingomonas sp.]|jgi:hypothetical protein